MKISTIVPLDLTAVPFAMRPIKAVGSRGSPYTRWIPYGMPQLGQYHWISDTVFFLYPDRASAEEGKSYGGTGFFVAMPSEKWGQKYFHIHGVTNWHVACQTGNSVMRVNRLDGGTEIFEFDSSEWVFPAGGNDIAVSPPLALGSKVHKVQAVYYQCLLTEGAQDIDGIGPAEDVFMVGRFMDYQGAETNEPAYRFGNISVVDAKVKQPTGFTGSSFIIDMHSRTGFSGSPVWLYRTPGTVFSRSKDLLTSWHYMRLIGIHWGQFPEQWELKAMEKSPESARSQASLITEGKYVEGLSGMTCAVPSSAILELLIIPKLRAMRAQVDAEVTPDPETRVMPQATLMSNGHSSFDAKRAISKHLGLDQPYIHNNLS